MSGDDNDDSGVSVGLAKQYVAVHSSFAIAATFVYATTAALVVIAKAHRMYIHRLSLYLALAGTLHALSMGLEGVPTDLSQPDNSTTVVRSGWYGACVLFGIVAQYFSFAKALVMVWICLYAFALVVLGKQLKQRKHEVGGALVVLLVPALLTWEPLLHHSYGLAGAVCWISGDYERGNSSFGYVIKMAFSIVPHCLMSFTGMVLIVAATLSLFRGAVRRNSRTQMHHWKALKEVLPLVAYPCVYYLIFVGRVVISFCNESIDSGVNNLVAVCLLQSSSVVLLLSLFMHPSYRSLLCDTLRPLCSKQGGPKFIVITTTSKAEAESKIKCIDQCFPTESDPLCA